MGERTPRPHETVPAGVRRLPAPELVGDMRADLGEGPVWETRAGRLIWVDIPGRRLLTTDPATGATGHVTLPSAVGVVVPRERGGYVAALEDGFWTLDEAGRAERLAAVEADDPGTRFNDGACDPQGRMWAGTMAWAESGAVGSLYRLGVDGTVERMLDGITISNGLGWSPDGATMYYVDTPTRRIDAFDFDGRDGRIANRRPFVVVPEGEGLPDGLCVDEEGAVWLALWGGWCLRRYLPDGTLDAVVPLPVAQVSSCAFGGEGLDELYITTARQTLSTEARRAQPLAGRLFRGRPGVRGLPRAAYAG
jgi:sugar lactone lactonase YvrE